MSLILLAVLCIAFCTFLKRVWHKENFRSRVLQSYFLQFTSVCIGATIAAMCSAYLNPTTVTVQYLTRYMEPDGTLTNHSDHLHRASLTKQPGVIFISTTDYSVTQVPSLLRAAQALYPVRHRVKWIIVSLPFETVEENKQVIFDDNTTFGAAISQRRDLKENHLASLRKLLSRFGVPFVLISSYGSQVPLQSKWNGLKWRKTNDKVTQAYQTGLLWALKNFSEGFLIFGDLNFVYNSALFTEIQQCNLNKVRVAFWPAGFTSETYGISEPTFMTYSQGDGNQTKIIIKGYVDDASTFTGHLSMQRGTFAVDINFLRDNVPYQEQWKLAADGTYTNRDLKINLNDIAIIGNQGTQILVWRTKMVRMAWPAKIKFGKNVLTADTNVKILMEAVFGPRYFLTKDLLVNAEGGKHYLEYDVKTHLSDFMD